MCRIGGYSDLTTSREAELKANYDGQPMIISSAIFHGARRRGNILPR